MTTAFVGAGRMGGAMVRRLTLRGQEVVVHARRAERRAELMSYGASVTDRIERVVPGAELVLSCLFDEQQVTDVLDGPDGVVCQLAPGATLVVHSTISPQLMRRLDDQARRRRAQVLDAPVSGSVDDVMAGRLTVLVGGAVETLDAARPAIETYCSSLVHTGEVGTASAIKLINNLVFAGGTQLAAEAMALGKRLGVDQKVLVEALSVSSAKSEALRRLAMSGSVAAHEAKVREFLSKDVALALAAADEAGTDVSVLRRLIHDGWMDLAPPGTSSP